MNEELFNKTLALVLKDFRVESGISQDELAVSCSLDRSYISDIENGKRNPSIGILLKIAEGLAIPLSAIILRTEIILKRGYEHEKNSS